MNIGMYTMKFCKHSLGTQGKFQKDSQRKLHGTKNRLCDVRIYTLFVYDFIFYGTYWQVVSYYILSTCCFRHVVIPKEMVKYVPKTHLMSEDEWRSIGIQQSKGWVHYMTHKPGNIS